MKLSAKLRLSLEFGIVIDIILSKILLKFTLLWKPVETYCWKNSSSDKTQLTFQA